MPLPPAPKVQSVLIGIALMASAATLFSGLDGIAKHLSAIYHPMQIAWMRYSFHLLLMLLVLRRSPVDLLRTDRPILQILRGAALLTCTLLFFTSLKFIPLADATAIGQIAPFFVTALSIPLLGEKVGPRRWTAIAVGIAGALVVIRPGLGVVHWAAFLLVVMAAVYALFQIATRVLSSTDAPTRTLFYSALVGTVGSTLIGPFFWEQPTWTDFGLMALMGALGGFGHYILILAFERAPASVLAPFSYVQIVTSALVGYLAFGDMPDEWTISGAILIAASGLYIFYREAKVRRMVLNPE